MRGWFKTLAGLNPISHLVEALRELVVNGWSASDAIEALLIPIAMGVITVSLALVALRRRLAAQ
jgi:hypothetical protein